MKVEVIAYGYLMTLLGGKRMVDLKDGAQLDDLTTRLATSLGGVKKGHLGPYNVETDLIVLINGRNVKTLTTPYSLADGDVVTFIPPYMGG